jgi:hypothetical protein
MACNGPDLPAIEGIGERRHAPKQGEKGSVVRPIIRNENKGLTWWYKLLTNGRHIAGIKPHLKRAADDTEINVCHLV